MTEVNPIEQNRKEAAGFTNDFSGYARQIEQDEAVGWARQFADPVAPAAADKATTAPGNTVADTSVPAQAQPVAKPKAEIGLPEPRSGLGVGRDVALGVIQAPRSLARGVTKGLNNMIGFIGEVSDGLPDITNLNDKGEFSAFPRVVSGAEERRREDMQRVNAGKKPMGDRAQFSVPHAPTVPTVTGNIIETISQFAVGFKGVDKVMKGGGIAYNISKGALADLLAFDQHEQRLSNVIESVPSLKNPVTNYLQSKPDDSVAEGKLKQGIEGLGLGVAGEALFGGIRMLKRGKIASEQLKAEGKTADDLFTVPPEEKAGIGVEAKQFDFLGDPAGDLLRRKQAKIDAATAEVQGAFGTPKQITDKSTPSINDFEINFARIQGPDDIKQLMDEMVNKPELKPSIEAARRGKMDAQATLTAATDIDGFDSLMARRAGDAFNAEQVIAGRKVYYDTTAKLMEAAKRAAGPEASDIDIFNFRKLVATHHAVQKEFMGMRAEAGRALAAWKIPVGGTAPENARALTEMLNETGGAVAAKDLASRIASLGNNLNTAQLNAITEKAWMARSADAMAEVWTMGLLTNPTTHVVNLSSNILTSVTLGLERFGMAFAKDTPVTLREGAAYFTALLDTQKMAIKNAAQAFRTGETGMGLGKIELPRARASARDVLDPEGKAGFFSKAIDGWGYVLNRYAGGALAMGDEYSKTLLYQAQLRSLATRQGIAQGMEGTALQQHVAQALQDPPAFMRADAATFANYGTFTKELGKTGQDIQRIIARNPALRFVVPFVRTPANIFKFTFARTPLGYLSQSIRDDIAAGGVRAAAAQTRIAMGTSFMALASDLAMNGKITGSGPIDPEQKAALKRTGWQPYSLKIGDTYYSYGRLDPLATLLGMAADMSEVLSNYEAYDIDAQTDVDSLGVAAAVAASNQVVGKTFMTGFADLVEVFSDPGRYGEGYIQRLAGSLVPAGVAGIERAVDPETEQAFSIMDGIKARIPGLSATVAPRRNIWGESIQSFYPEEKSILGASAERVLSLVNPIYYSKERDAPVDRWMLKNGFSIDMPDKIQVIDDQRVDLRKYPKAYDRLVALRGNELKLMKYGDQTMKEFFTNLAEENDPFGRHVGFFLAVGGNDFDTQQNLIRKVVNDYTAAAREQMLEEFPEVGQAVQDARQTKERTTNVRPSLRDMQKEIAP